MTGRRERGVREGTAAVLFPHLWQPVLKKTVKTVRGCQHNIGGDKGSATGVFEGAICCLETAKACGVRVPVREGIGSRLAVARRSLWQGRPLAARAQLYHGLLRALEPR